MANAQVALLISWGTERGRSVSSCSAAAARKGSQGTYASLAKALHHDSTSGVVHVRPHPNTYAYHTENQCSIIVIVATIPLLLMMHGMKSM